MLSRNPAGLVGALLSAAAVLSSSAWADPGDSRYSLNRADDGYVRLDGRTGQVSVCTRDPAGWTCRLVADERAALEAEINRLRDENVALKKELLDRNIPLPGLVKPELPAPEAEAPRQAPEPRELDKLVGLIEKLWRRMVDAIAALQRDIFNKS
jgi:hypothetical protein